MVTLSDFKRRLKVGVELETIHAHIGSFGTRKVSIVQSNSFALSTTRTTGEVVDSWCEYPKAKDFEIVDKDTVNIYWGEGERREKILTYKFV